MADQHDGLADEDDDTYSMAEMKSIQVNFGKHSIFGPQPLRDSAPQSEKGASTFCRQENLAD